MQRPKSIIDYRKEAQDIVYFDASIQNREDVARELNFSQNRGQSILEKANDYYLAVVRFSIPHDSIAIFNFQQDDYYVGIGTKTGFQLQYVNRGNPFSNLSNTFQGIYSFQQFLDSINNALAAAHAAAPASPGNPPIMILEEDGRFSLNVDVQYTEEIFFNYRLYQFFLGLDATFLSFSATEGYSIQYGFIFNNTFTYQAPLIGTYYKMLQENKSQYLFSNIKYIVITTNSMPCSKEYLGIGNFNSSNEVQAVSDFIPIQEGYESYDRSPWFYNVESPRLVDLESDGPLRKVDFRIFLVNRDNFFFPLSIAPGQTVDVKFAFYKKSLFNNEYDGLFDYMEERRPTGISHSRVI
jgi:hypothetical protein